MKSAQSLILSYNKSYPEPRQIEKYRAMQESLLRFYRGTCHLFYDRLDTIGAPKDKTRTWICGDLHLENFGSFKGDNRLVYFDINDFDEAVLAPVSWDVLRFITAILVSGDFLKYTDKEASSIARSALRNYTAAIIRGKALIEQRETATGLMKQFFDQTANRRREDFIDRVTIKKGKRRSLKIDNIRTRKLKPELHKRLMDWLPGCLASLDKMNDLAVRDCAFRIAGIGSLGLDRYVILAKQKSTGKNFLLDMKEAKVSSLLQHLHVKQPEWKNQADRIITTQSRMQFCPPALLSSEHFDKKYFVLKELQPIQDKMDFNLCGGIVSDMEHVILSMADISAYAHLRSTGRHGSSTADDLAGLVSRSGWQKDMYNLSQELSIQMGKDYKAFLEYKIPGRA
ncbi:MAG: hypothetical protein JWO03_2424 [Bacteroidetes bacterium]|nr:hypothetical protein [Bacteroidota bacterium]